MYQKKKENQKKPQKKNKTKPKFKLIWEYIKERLFYVYTHLSRFNETYTENNLHTHRNVV